MQPHCKFTQHLLCLPPPVIASEHPFMASVHELLDWCCLNQFSQSTFYGIKLRAEKLRRQGQNKAAFESLIKGLRLGDFWSHHPRWWTLMCMAVNLVHDAHLHQKLKSRLPMRLCTKLIMKAPQPWSGRDVAYCFLQCSLWAFQDNKIQKAIQCAQSAVYADPNWGYGDYLLGCYALQLGHGSPLVHFERAIQADASLNARLIEDDLIRQFPKILAKFSNKG